MSEKRAGLHKGRLDFFFTPVTRLFDVCCHSTSEKARKGCRRAITLLFGGMEQLVHNSKPCSCEWRRNIDQTVLFYNGILKEKQLMNPALFGSISIPVPAAAHQREFSRPESHHPKGLPAAIFPTDDGRCLWTVEEPRMGERQNSHEVR